MLIPARTGGSTALRIDPRVWTRRIPAETWIVVAITVLGAALRFATLASQSYWYDEAVTVHEVQLPFGAMLHAVHGGESSPPLYFALAWAWGKLFGTSEVGLRSLSAVLGCGLVPVAYGCASELVSRSAGIAAAALVAVNPFMLWYSQEARAYSLFGALCGLSFLFFARSLRDPSRTNLVAFAASAGLALATHFFSAFLVAPEALWLLVVFRSRAVLAATGALAAVQLAILPLAIADASHPLQGWIRQFPLSIRIQQVPVDFSLGTLYQTPLVSDGLYGAVILGAIVLALLAVGGGMRERRGALIAAVMAGAAILLPLILAEAGRDYFIARNLMPGWLPLAVLLAAACAAPRARVAGAAVFAVLLAGFVYADVRIGGTPEYQRPPWRKVAAALGTSGSPRAIVAYQGPFATVPLSLYVHRARAGVPAHAAVSVSELDVIGSPWQAQARSLPPGVTLLGSKAVDQYLVVRFGLRPGAHTTSAGLVALAGRLVSPAPQATSVLLAG